MACLPLPAPGFQTGTSRSFPGMSGSETGAFYMPIMSNTTELKLTSRHMPKPDRNANLPYTMSLHPGNFAWKDGLEMF